MPTNLHPHTYEGDRRNTKAGMPAFDTARNQHEWRNARTLKQFGIATARWLEGEIGAMPTNAFYEQPNEETMPLLPFINPLNRSGILVSTFSQPACTATYRPYGGIMDEQRAAIGGFVSPQFIEPLANAAASGMLEFVANPPGSDSSKSTIEVSRKNGKPITFIGYVLSPDDIANDYGGYPGLDPNMIKVLQNCYQIDIYDPEWGRNDRLWPMLQKFFQSQYPK